MSALPDEPAHLLAWLTARGSGPTRRRSSSAGCTARTSASCSVPPAPTSGGWWTGCSRSGPTDPGFASSLAGQPPLRARGVVLALGNFPPELPPGWTALAPRLAWRTPWAAPDDWPAPDAEVLLLGAALTAVDVVLSLLARGHRGRIHLLSRRGILPMTHPPRMLAPLALGERPSRLRPLLRLFREASARDDARAVLDTLRPELGVLWQGLTPVEQRRFLRHLRPWFDAVRHRLAPEVGARIAALEVEGGWSGTQGASSPSPRRTDGWRSATGRGARGRSRSSRWTWRFPPPAR